MEAAMVSSREKETHQNINLSLKNVWNDESGIGPTGTIRQGLVKLHARAMKEGKEANERNLGESLSYYYSFSAGHISSDANGGGEPPKPFTLVRKGDNVSVNHSNSIF